MEIMVLREVKITVFSSLIVFYFLLSWLESTLLLTTF